MQNRIFTGAVVVLVSLAGSACSQKKVAAAAPVKAPVPVEEKKAPAPVAAERPAPRQEAAPAVARSRTPDEATKKVIQNLLDKIQDAYFDYDKYTIRPDAEVALRANVKELAEILRQYPDYKLVVEGYCDERGSEEYNVALGDARAKHAKEFMASLGLPTDQMRTISYGKARQVCQEASEDCWQKNRRAHISQP